MRRALLALLGALVAYTLADGDQQLFILEMEEGETEAAREIADQHGFRLIRRISWAEPVTPFVREKRRFVFREVSKPVVVNHTENLMGTGVIVAILDDGVDYSHPALSSSFRPEHSFDFVRDVQDPFPEDSPDNNHGTHCAGVVSMYPASCGTGVAPGASLSALKMLGSTETINDVVEGDALAYHHRDIDIYSVSWGPRDDGKAAETPRKLANMALNKGATDGRQGKGSLYIWASGNGGLEGDDCAMDGYASHKHTLTFGVVGANGKPEWYAEGCPAVIASVPSSSASWWTTEVGGGCTQFSGSSAATPYAAGVLALLLEANPNLTQRDVQHLLVLSSNSEDLVKANPEEWTTNGAGLPVSRYFGFGSLDSKKIISMARGWKNVKAEKSCTQEIDIGEGSFSSEKPLKLSVSVSCKEIASIERIQLEVSLSHPRRGDIHIQLTSSAGSVTDLLRPRRNDDSSEGLTDWRFVSLHSWGEKANGKWTIQLNDVGKSQGGTLTKATLFIHGT